MTKLLLFGAVATVLTATAALAQSGDAMSRAEVHGVVRDAFQRIDGDHDGFVSEAELTAYRLDRREAERQAEFEQLDLDGDGTITRDEFFEGRERTQGEDDPALAAGVFEQMDANRDGRVSLGEATQQGLRQFDALDSNRDGRVTSEERRSLRAEGDSLRI